MNHSARDAGVEPATYGFGAREKTLISPALTALRGNQGATSDLATSVLLKPSEEAIAALAQSVLEAAPESVRLAVEALSGGPLAIRRGIELAALILAAKPADVAPASALRTTPHIAESRDSMVRLRTETR